MSDRVSDCPPLLQPGEHDLIIQQIEEIGVAGFPLSKTRADIWSGFLKIIGRLVELKIPCKLVVDGSFLTEEIDPDDIDFAVVVTPEFYDLECSDEQRTVLDWIGDDKTIKDTHLSDCYLCVDYKPGQDGYFEGICDQGWWVRLFAESVVYKRRRGVAIVTIAESGRELASSSTGQD